MFAPLRKKICFLGAILLLASAKALDSCAGKEETCTGTEGRAPKTSLKPLEISRAILDQNVYQMGLPPTIRTCLLDYCDKVGITKRFRELLQDPLEVHTWTAEEFAGVDWFLQRPVFNDNDNLHMMSPENGQAQEEYLKVGGSRLILTVVQNASN